MGLGRIRTRSGLETSHHQQPSRCKPLMKSVVLWVKDLVLFLVFALPGTPTTCRVYGLIFTRTVLYAVQGLVFYALALTISMGEKVKNPGVLVELTRLLLCHNTNNINNSRNKRATPNVWQSLVSDINQTYPEMSDVLNDLLWTTENATTPDFTISSTTLPPSTTSTMSYPLNNTNPSPPPLGNPHLPRPPTLVPLLPLFLTTMRSLETRYLPALRHKEFERVGTICTFSSRFDLGQVASS